MEKRTIAVIAAAILLIPLSVWLSADRAAVGADSAGTDFRNTVTVTGEGKLYAASDEAVVTVGATTVRNTASKALVDNTTATNKILAALKSSGLSGTEIQTGNVSLYPQQNWQEGKAPTIISYTAQNQFVVRTKQLTKLGAIIDAATKAGATDISGLQFDLSEDSVAYKNALKQAVAKAKSQGETLAQEIGKTLGQAIIINQGTSGGSIVPMVYNSMAMDKAGSAPNIIPQDVQVNATVTVTYTLN